MTDFGNNLKKELAPFWRSLWRGHARDDLEARSEDFADLSERTRNVLVRAGFTCRLQVAACPTWLLLTVPMLGPRAAAEIRGAIPFDAAGRQRRARCPGRAIEGQRDERRRPMRMA